MLAGLVPPEIGNLRVLEKLRLHQNCLRGIIPMTMGNLMQLEECTLNTNAFCKRPPLFFVSLRSTLRVLDLSGNDYTQEEIDEMEAFLVPRLTGATSALRIW